MQINVPYDAFEYLSEKYLTPDELLVFCFLYKWKNADNEIFFSINKIDHVLKLAEGSVIRNRVLIKELVISLQDKAYIDTNVHMGSKSEVFFVGNIRHDPDEYAAIDVSLFDVFLNDKMNKAKLKLYLYANITKYKNGARLSYSVMSQRCKYFKSKKHHSVSLIQEVVDELDGKYIFRFSGEKKEGSLEQEINLYHSDRNMDELKYKQYQEHVKSKSKRKKDIRNDYETVKFNSTVAADTVGELKGMLKETGWGKRDQWGNYVEISEFDYFVYRLAKDEGVGLSKVKKIDAAIKALRDNPDCRYAFDEWEAEYLKEMSNAVGE